MDVERSRFTEEQIIGILREQEAGRTTPDICCRLDISEGTFQKWRSIRLSQLS